MDKSSIRVLLVEDHETWRRYLSTTLGKEKGLKIIGEATDGLEAVEKAEELQPDLILLDIGLPKLNGIEAARRIRKISPASKILFVSDNRSADIAEAALNTGASGYVIKSEASGDLLSAVNAVLEGKLFVSSSMTGCDLVREEMKVSSAALQMEENPYRHFVGNELISEFLALVMDASSADFGNVQLFDSTNDVLRIVAQHGFPSEFLNYFNTVSGNKKCLCGSALNRRSRIIITDVATDPLFSDEAREVLLRANVRSVVSTPLIDNMGKFVGLISTHRNLPSRPLPDVLSRVDDLVASFLARLTTR